MDSRPVIVDISSDDEDDGSESIDFPSDWPVDLLEGEDTDDVMVVGEFSCLAAVQNRNLPHSTVNSVDILDDDCLILDGDPDKLATVKDDRVVASDDLIIIAEKGPVACRDFPHPRHLCVQFPFGTTPHEKHCDLCHCYVCDTHAPCCYWGTGVSPNDHCHSTDKEERWKTERKQLKLGSFPSPNFQKFPDITLSITPPLHYSEPTLPISQSPNLDAVMLRTPVSKTNQILSIPSNNFIMPNVISRNTHNQHSRFVPSRSSIPQSSVRVQLMSEAHNIQRKTSNSRPLFIAYSPRFKKTGPLGAYPVINRSGFDFSNQNQIFTVNPDAQASSDGINQNTWHDIPTNGNPEMSAVHNFTQPNNSNFTDPPAPAPAPVPPLPPYYLTSGFLSSTVSSEIQANFQALPAIGKHNQPLLPLIPNTNMPELDNPVQWECNSNSVDLSWINSPTANALPQILEEPQLPTVQSPESPYVMVPEATATLSSLAFHMQNWSPEHVPIPGPTKDQVLSELDYYPQSPTHTFGYNFQSTWSGLADV